MISFGVTDGDIGNTRRRFCPQYILSPDAKIDFHRRSGRNDLGLPDQRCGLLGLGLRRCPYRRCRAAFCDPSAPSFVGTSSCDPSFAPFRSGPWDPYPPSFAPCHPFPYGPSCRRRAVALSNRDRLGRPTPDPDLAYELAPIAVGFARAAQEQSGAQ